MPRVVFSALVAILCVVAPVKFESAPGAFFVFSDATAAKSPRTVTIDLALLSDDWSPAGVTWIRIVGEHGDLAGSASGGGQITVGDLLYLGKWEIVSNGDMTLGTSTSAARSINSDIYGRAERGAREYELLLGEGLLVRGFRIPVAGKLAITRDSPGVYSGLGYIDFGVIQRASALRGGGVSQNATTLTQSAPLVMSAAASAGGVMSDRYVVWPEAVSLGETVAVLLDTKTEVDLYPDGALLNANIAKFSIQLTDASDGSTGTISPRAVIEVPAALGSAITGLGAESWTGIVVLFDLPDPWPPNLGLSYPTDLTVRVDYEGFQVFNGRKLTITAGGGSPLSATDFLPLSELEHRPMLRLRPSWEATPGIGFDPTWVIGGLEFTLRYHVPPVGNVANLSGHVNGDATRALVVVNELSAPQGEKAWRISLVAPEGFSIPAKGCVGAGDCYAGRWSLLDLPLERIDQGQSDGTPIFGEGDFWIEDLKVIGLDGVQLNPNYSSETFFRKYAVNNLAGPQGGGGAAQHMIWPMQAYAGDTIAALFHTEGDVVAAAPEALLDADAGTYGDPLDPGNVMVKITDPDAHVEFVQPSAVIEVPAAIGSQKVGSPAQSQTGVVAFFEFPDPWPNPNPTYSLPADFAVAVEYGGAPTTGGRNVRIVGTGGVKTDFDPVATPGNLELGPMLRLRPVWDALAQEGFDPSWTVGSLEFTLRFDIPGTGDVNNLTVVSNGEAIAALVMATGLPQVAGARRWKVTLVHPQGFTLPSIGCNGNDCFSGRWSLLDFPLEKDETGVVLGDPVFVSDDFSIESLAVFDLNGNPMNASGTLFHNYAVNNIALPEPGASVQLLFGVLGLTALNWFHHRKRKR